MSSVPPNRLWSLIRRLLGISWNYRRPIIGGWICLGIQAALMASLTQVVVPLINLATKTEGAGERTMLRIRNSLEPTGLWDPLARAWHHFLDFLPNALKLEDHGKMAVLCMCIGLAIIVAFARAIFVRWGYILSHFVSFKALTDIRAQVNEVLIWQRLSYYDKWRPGELMSRLQNDMETMSKALIFVCNEAPKAGITIITGMCFAVIKVPELSAVLFAAPLFWIPLKKIGKAVKRSSRHTLEMKGELTNDMHQQFGGIREIKGFRMESERQTRFENTNNSVFSGYMGIINARAMSRAIVEGGGYILFFLTLGAAVFIALRFGITFGEFGAFALIVMAMILNPLRSVSRAYNNFQESLPGAQTIFEIIDGPLPLEERDTPITLPDNPETIHYENVNYRYSDDTDQVLDNISLTARRGEVIALVGPTGSGKSTLVDLLSRLRDPDVGRICFDNVDLRDAAISDIRTRVAHVTQDPYLFNMSVRDNLLAGKPGANDKTLWEILDTVHLTDIVKDKGGLDAAVGERGSQFSGGQRQRLAIARALLRDAPILVLDEATSAQDSVTEQALQESLELLMKGRTTFVIAHRLATVRHADRVCVLKDGRLVEQGTHDELKDSNGEYAKLYETQFADS